jgi:hypothetical protein
LAFNFRLTTNDYKTNDYKTSDYKTNNYKTSDYKTSDYKTSDYKTNDLILSISFSIRAMESRVEAGRQRAGCAPVSTQSRK